MATIDVKTRGFDGATQKQEAHNKAAKKLGPIHRATADEARRAANLQQRLLRDVETGQERYNRKLKEAQVAFAGHAREKEILTRVENKLQRELRESSLEYREQARTQKESAERARKIAEARRRDEERLRGDRLRQRLDDAAAAQQIARQNETATERYQRRLRELDALQKRVSLSERAAGRERKRLADEHQRELDQTRRKLEMQGRAADKAFDTRKVASWGAAIVGPTATAAKLLSTLRQIRGEQDAAANALNQTSRGAGALAQLAGDDPAKLNKLLAASDKTFGEGFVRTREDADNLTFELDSAELLKFRRFFSRLSAIDNAEVLTKSVKLVQTGFEGVDETGGPKELVSKFIAAAAPATGVSPSQVGEGAAISSSAAAAFGLRDEENLAAVSRVSEVTGNARVAGTRVSSLFTALARQGLADQLKGKGLREIIAAVDRLGLDEQGLIEFLGSDEAQKAFSILKNTSALDTRVAAIDQAAASGLAEKQIAIALNTRRIGSAVRQRRGEAQVVLSRDQQAADTSVVDEIASNREAALRRRGTPELVIAFENLLLEAFRTIDGDAETATRSRELDRIGALLDATDRQTQAIQQAPKDITKAIRESPATVPVR